MVDHCWVSVRGVRAVASCVALVWLAGCAIVPGTGTTGAPETSATPQAAGSSPYRRLATSEGTDTSKGHNDQLGLWAIAEQDAENDTPGDLSVLLRQQQNWRRAVEHDFPPGGDITCDPRTFLPLNNSVLVNVAVTGPDHSVLQSPDPALLTKALRRAQGRILRVTEDGRELTEEQYEKLAGAGEDDSYTPNDVSDPEGYTGVVGISDIDTKGVRYVWLERTVLRIVAEELREAGAVPARIVPYLDADTLAWLRERGEVLPTEDELR
jgi:hypothetical protein